MLHIALHPIGKHKAIIQKIQLKANVRIVCY